jgi:hypothetical protein
MKEQEPSTLNNELDNNSEKERDVLRFSTVDGESYHYLSDDKVIREKGEKTMSGGIKSREKGLYDTCVFIPSYDALKRISSPTFDVQKIFGKNEEEYQKTLLSYFKPNFQPEVIDEKGNNLNNNKEIKNTKAYAFISLSSSLKLPVAKKANINYHPFSIDHTNKKWHLGNKIREINDSIYAEPSKTGKGRAEVEKRQELQTIVDKEWDSIDTVITAKGSSYKYLPDGTTQRFKKVENKYYEPQSALVYIPNYEWLKANALTKLEEAFGKQFDGEGDYQQFLLQYIHKKGLKPYIFDKNNLKLETNKEIAEARARGEVIRLALGTEKEIHFTIPVSHLPKVGFLTYDTKKFYDKGEKGLKRWKHIGNKVVEIIKKQ